MAERVIVIGADAAGMSAAGQLRRRRSDVDIIALEKGRWTSYSACGIPYVVAGEVASLDDLVVRTPNQHRARHVDVRLHHEVVGVDVRARRVAVRDHAHRRDVQLAFDQLLFANGSRPSRPDVPGADADFVQGVQTLDDAETLIERAKASRCAKVVVVGGGYVGLEMAEAFLRWGAEVTVVEGSDQLMRTFDPDIAELIRKAVEGHGVEVRLGEEVTGFEPGRVLTRSGALDADLVVLGLGVRPNSELAETAGLELGAKGAIAVDQRQRTSVEGIWAAGDCAQSFHRVRGSWVHVALGTVANRAGRVAGINMAGGYARFEGVVGTAVSRICATEVGRTGLGEAEAAAAGYVTRSATIESRTRAGYYPDAGPITVKLVGEVGTGRVLGGQIVGREGSAKRTDVLAAVISSAMTADELIDLDLSYAPPFSPVWDPVAVAARALAPLL